ncbi:hypothetical protein Patl1_17807 [Pistacia atlantica]|uniref:Uncharacterized protein n=1 Tax=Pistacia atlantica TaxID=434234 RepID=A0ACC1C253_9ROSI|nr:hypothetical protein Patl1_17807 [Pistacia atlantica]
MNLMELPLLGQCLIYQLPFCCSSSVGQGNQFLMVVLWGKHLESVGRVCYRFVS